MAQIRGFLKKREDAGLLRRLRPVSFRKNGRIIIEGKEYIDFSSNDYLGLSNHPRIIKAGIEAMREFGAGACASRLLSGDLELHHKLEEETASFKNKEAALFFNSGYQANTGIISALYAKEDAVFLDRLSHASLIDGALLSQAKLFRFRHNDCQGLETLLKKERLKYKSCLIVTESVFSMDGDKAPLKELVYLKEKYDCALFVDEAHATGIFGEKGSGMVEENGLSEKIDFIMGTFSKALGGFGAYVAVAGEIRDYLINTCRSFIYSTALPASVVACNIAAIELVREEPFRRQRLLKSAELFREGLNKRGFNVKGDSHIAPVIIGENIKTMELSYRLQGKGFWALPIRPPTVPPGEARLRFSLTYNHSEEMLGDLINELSAD